MRNPGYLSDRIHWYVIFLNYFCSIIRAGVFWSYAKRREPKHLYYNQFVTPLWVTTINLTHYQSLNLFFYLLAANLNILDSLFLKGLDSLIFNSVCPEIKGSKAKIFNVHCKIENKQDKVYNLTVFLDNIIQIYPQEDFKGRFYHNGNLFLWYYDLPEKLLSISDKKNKLTYTKGIYVASDLAEFKFSYSVNKLELKGICCY